MYIAEYIICKLHKLLARKAVKSDLINEENLRKSLYPMSLLYNLDILFFTIFTIKTTKHIFLFLAHIKVIYVTTFKYIIN